jgi:ankyrin repeat protein
VVAVALAIVVGLLAAAGPSGLRLRRQQMLVHAAVKGHEPIMRVLLAAGADPRSNATGSYPLYAAAWHGQAAAIELLVERGAEVDARESSGATALMGAAAQGRDEAIRRLLAHGASLAVSCDAGNALDIARANGHESTAALLAAAGATPSRAPRPAPE